MYRNNNKNIVIAILLICVLMITIGYSLLSQKLNIKGFSNIDSIWSIKITNAVLENATGGATEETPISYNDLSANFDIGFKAPGDTIKYSITVTNEGNMNAVLDSIKVNLESQEIINFKVEGIKSGEVLNANESKTFTIEFEFDENVTEIPDITSFDISMDTNFLQEGNSSNFSDANNSSLDELIINSINLTPSENSIIVNVNANNAVKYYYSIDNNVWYESTSNIYTFSGLDILTNYTVYVKAEDVETNVVVSSASTTTVDQTAPILTYKVQSSTLGENRWYKDLIINISTKDNVKVKTLYICSTTGNKCEPTTEVTLTNNEYNYIFSENSNKQRICMKALDEANNSSGITCTSTYKVDGVDPTLNAISVTPDDDTMTISIEATDISSGLNKYYFSKNSGIDYIESSEPNFTFTNLEEGDYLVVAYVKDTAGNISTTDVTTTTIRHNSWCEENGISDLGECIISTEGKNANIEIAKQNIEAKGEPNFLAVSPSINYEEKHSSQTTIVTSIYGTTSIGTEYTFDNTTGTYKLVDAKSYLDPTTIDYTADDYYMTEYIYHNSNSTKLHKITGVTSTTNESTGLITYRFTVLNYTQSVISYDTSEVGMYSTTDADNNKTYYYRGSVSGNYVKFADKYWRVIRVNGDGSVRLIYDGTSIYENGTSTDDKRVSKINYTNYYNDNTYIGYMYGDPSKFEITDSGSYVFNQGGLSTSAKYAFGTTYTFDETTRAFKISGDIIKGTNASDKEGYYTCWETDENTACQRLIYTKKYKSPTIMQSSGVGYGTSSLSQAQENITDSNIKDYLENTWYPQNLAAYDEKLSKPTIFCNNRVPSEITTSAYTNEGYGIKPTYYAWTRYNDSDSSDPTGPTLACNTNDSFTASTTTGNGKLTKPVGLISIDEVILAGGTYDAVNVLYYLYGGNTYWTMSPARMDDWFHLTSSTLSSTGKISHTNYKGTASVRPVINLDTSKITFTGSGTKEDPFIVS